ncbi:hypothetical protein V2J09_001837 [Rumex salicifolius]
MELQSCEIDLEADERRRFDDDLSELKSKFFLDGVGLVVFSVDSTGVSWKLDDTKRNESFCLGKKLGSISAADVKFSDIYAAELDDFGLIQPYVPQITGWCLLKNQGAEMHRFRIHGVRIIKTHWVPMVYTFGHADLHVCRTFVNQINAYLNKELGRPKSLMVFVNPLSGRRKGQRTWEAVAPVFTRAIIRTKVIVTERAGHAFDAMASMGNQELDSYDGVVAVGGDGFFNEILNGFLLSRLKAPCPPIPPDFVDSHYTERFNRIPAPNEAVAGTSEDEDQSPLLSTSECDVPGSPFFKVHETSGSTEVGGANVSIPNKKFRFGLIPAGSTDAIVITTGARDPITSALQIVLGKRVSLDIAQVIKWKTTYESKEEPSVRYTASFVGYGFYGDVIMESEKYRWMGPSRYDFAGTKVFLKRRSYEAEVAYLEVKPSEQTSQSNEEDNVVGNVEVKNGKCRANCQVCSAVHQPATESEQLKWLSSRGRFISVGSAVITCRNERAPDGLVADAHLSDGFLHLILIKECPRPLYLRHLLELAKKGGNPLDFKFIEHHKTLAFAFTSFGEQSIWNLDGELLKAHKLSAQVFRGLISLFATGPEV